MTDETPNGINRKRKRPRYFSRVRKARRVGGRGQTDRPNGRRDDEGKVADSNH